MAVSCEKENIIVVCGPTATGKTAIAVQLAKAFNGEVVSADSMQVYKGLDIGTAKVTQMEMRGVPHHLLNILSPAEEFSVAAYTAAAKNAITSISSKGRLPFICGGTGLYISSLVNGITFTQAKTDNEIREHYKTQWVRCGAVAMYEKLKKIDSEYAKKLHPNDKTRILRALELYCQTGSTMTEQLRTSRQGGPPYNVCLLMLAFEDRQKMYNRIDARVDVMLEAGLLEEAAYVYKNQDLFKTAAKAIGYKEFFPYFEGRQTIVECTAKLKQASRNYAKRQVTWFKSMQNTAVTATTQLIYMDNTGYGTPFEIAAREVDEFLQKSSCPTSCPMK